MNLAAWLEAILRTNLGPSRSRHRTDNPTLEYPCGINVRYVEMLENHFGDGHPAPNGRLLKFWFDIKTFFGGLRRCSQN
jgi:hypothetical protein